MSIDFNLLIESVETFGFEGVSLKFKSMRIFTEKEIDLSRYSRSEIDRFKYTHVDVNCQFGVDSSRDILYTDIDGDDIMYPYQSILSILKLVRGAIIYMSQEIQCIEPNQYLGIILFNINSALAMHHLHIIFYVDSIKSK